MKSLAKKITKHTPLLINQMFFRIYENYYGLKVKKIYKYINSKNKNRTIENILFYHPSGLSFGGTEKFLQMIAKYLPNNYGKFYMYSPKDRETEENTKDGRKYYLENESINLIPFNFSKYQDKYPYIYEDMSPTIYNIIKEHNIDLIITTGSGYSEFPFNIIKNIPIIMLNIFGSPSSQKNIIKHICISNEVRNKITHVVPKEKTDVLYIPSEKPRFDQDKIDSIRNRFNIKDTDFVFGRIGRASDEIFDPIGINAFKEVVKEYPNSHYLIMSAPPILKKTVEDEKIPNVHFLETSYDESDVWAFHQTIDVLAHFRNDGESCGLNIIESMLCGNPIITHRSHIWNAHLEYLKSDSSRVAEKDNVEQYTGYMKEMIKLKDSNDWNNIIKELKSYANEKFLVKNSARIVSKIIEEYDQKNNK